MQRKFEEYINDLQKHLKALPTKDVEILVKTIQKAAKNKGTVFLAGNGGSAATANHFTCDLVSLGIRAICLSENTPVLTAIANDYGYENIFSNQLKMLAQSKDLLVVLTASGNSPNIINALKTAKKLHLQTFGILGFGGGKAKNLVGNHLIIPSKNYKYIEDLHLIVVHLTAEILKSYA